MKFEANLSLRKILSIKKITIPLSIVLAFAIWLSITINKKPNMERTISGVPVSINLENTFANENKMSIIGDISEQKFTVVLQGPSYAISSLSSKDLSLYASAAEVDAPGEYNLKVALSNSSNAEYSVVSITPAVISVTFDYIETKEFSVIALAEGAVAKEGLIAETGVVGGTEKDTISISGPRTVVNRIEKVVASAKVNKTLSASETFDAEIVLYDENNNLIDNKNLTLSETKVKVTVPISKKKTVPVKVDFTNLPSGFNKDGITATVDHPTVTVIGTPETVDKTTQVLLSAIDISSVSTSSQSFDVSPKLPEGVRLLDTIEYFTVTVDTSKYVEKIITVNEFRYKDLSQDVTANGVSQIKNVKICVPKAIANKFDASKVYAELSLADKKTGAHTVNATICFDGYDNIWAIGTYTTTVTLK